MSLDDILNLVEQALPPSRFGAIERFILRQSWLGQTYSQMAQESGYGSEYIKEVGSRLWQDLSDAVGERVTKKNLQLVFNQRQNGVATLTNLQGLPDKTTVSSWSNPTAATQEVKIGFPSGPIPLDSSFYIERPPVENLVCAEIKQPGCVIRIKAPRQMGKSSLLNRVLAHARSLGYWTVHLDFREADQTIFSSLDRFLRWFCINISRRLQIEPDLESYWDEEMGSKVSCKIYFSAYLLEQIHVPIVLVLNEVNQLFEHPDITQDFLPMLRFWHEQAKQEPIWQKLRLVLAHTTDVYVPLNLNQSPFNVGLAVKLPPFTRAQVQELAQRYGLNWENGVEANQAILLHTLVGGHPYLVNLALYHLCQNELTIEQLLQSAATPTGIYSPHLRQMLSLLQANPDLLSALQQVVMAEQPMQLEAIMAHKLESMGLLQLQGKLAQPSCELYRTYFREQLNHPGSTNEAHPSTPEAVNGLTPKNSLVETKLDQAAYTPTEVHSTEINQTEANAKALHLAQNSNPLDSVLDQEDTARSPQWLEPPAFHQLLEILWQEAVHKKSLLSLIRCEVDYLQYLIEAYGAERGESCLSKIVATIQDCTANQSALITRYGNAEFAIVLPLLDQQAVIEIAESIRVNVQALAIAHDHSRVSGFPAQVITVSLGIVSAVPGQHITPEALFTAAERALHQAKRQGRNRVSAFTT